jgi:glycosyltransferase involved in cell wall biosynthesis/protein-tyrosine-phosphatase
MTPAGIAPQSLDPSVGSLNEPAASVAPARPIRILYLRGTLILCGPGKTILNTWRMLDSRRFHVTIVATRPEKGERNAFLDAAAALRAPHRELAIGRGVDLKAVWRLVRMIRQEQIDILQTHDSETRRIGILAAALAGVPHVTSVHGYICNDRKERIVRWLDHQVLRLIAHVITVSGRLRQDLLDVGLRPERITLLQNAVMLTDYSSPGEGAVLRTEFGIPEHAGVVSIVGRLSAEKGHEDFLQAALTVLKAVPDTRFLIVGDGPLRGQLERRIGELALHGRVFLTGHRSNLAELYGLTDVLAISSYTEGIPNVLLEAFAYGRPAVATTVGGVPEVLEDGRTGYLVAPGEPGQLAERLITLLEDATLREGMGRAARRAVEDRFSFVERTKALERLYEQQVMPAAGLSFAAANTSPAVTTSIASHATDAAAPLQTLVRARVARGAALLRRAAGKAVRTVSNASERLRHNRRYSRAVEQITGLKPRSMLMVCLGNICRSPYAAFALARALENHDIQIDSGGFIGPGRPSPEQAQAAAAALGIDLSPHRSKILTAELLRQNDLIVVMEPAQRQTLIRHYGIPSTRILVFGDLDPAPIVSRTIVDPYGGSLEVFAGCYRRIDRCVAVLAGILAATAAASPSPVLGSTNQGR